MKRLFGRSAAVILSVCMFFQGIGEDMANVAAAPEKVSGETEVKTMEETILFEEGFESGQTGKWSGRGEAELSVVTENPNSGSYCMKISGRTAPASGAELEIGSMLQGNQRLQISAYVRYTEGPDSKRVQLTMFYDGKYYIVGGKDLSRGEWCEITGSMVVSEGLDMSEAVLFFETPWTPEPSAEQDLMDIYVDDVKATLYPFSDISNYPSLKELYKHQFLVGVAVPDNVLNTPVYSKLVEQQFNSMTMENEMKPGYILDEKTSKSNLNEYKEHAALSFESYKTGMEYAKKHGIAMRGHTLIWHSQTPDWFFYEDYDVSGKLADRKIMLKRMENYIKDVIEWTETNYSGVIYAWDVVNEAIADYDGEGAAPMRESLWYKVIGEDFVEKAFEYARKYTRMYAPDHEIKLIYNDFNEYFPAKRDGIVAMLKPIQEAGNIDGMGMQSHFDTSWPLEGDAGYMTAIRKFRDELGIEIHVTELDIGIAEGDTVESQGIYFQKFMEALLKEKKDGTNITSVTFWGLSDGLSWRADEHCLLFNDDLSRKPAFHGVVNAIGETGAVIDKIRAIGTVELTETCKQKIEEVRKMYDALTDAQKELVPGETLNVLTEAETEYERLSKEAQKPPTPEKILISKAEVSAIPAQSYTGEALEPSITVTYNGRKLVKDSDYTVSFKNNVKIGTAEVTISGKGDYTGEFTKEFSIVVEKNKVYVAGNYEYRITNANTDGKGTVALTGVKDISVKKKLKKINVISTVDIGGKKFKVTEIGKSAFLGCTKATSATIGSNIVRVGAKSFYNCKRLKSITIKTSKLTSKSVGAKAFKGIYEKPVIKVPKKQRAAYKKLLQKKGVGKKAIIK